MSTLVIQNRDGREWLNHSDVTITCDGKCGRAVQFSNVPHTNPADCATFARERLTQEGWELDPPEGWGDRCRSCIIRAAGWQPGNHREDGDA